MSDYDNSGPVPQLQKTYVHNSTELEIQDHSNEPLSSTLVLELGPSVNTTDTSLQELELFFSPMYDEYFSGENQVVMKNQKDEDNTVIRNKARLVAKGYRQEEGIDFEESFDQEAMADHVWIEAMQEELH
nr:retrovirus-related Pol polyprotein from transposon TNT 1-94 [Tanacetum cinerariifolium]